MEVTIHNKKDRPFGSSCKPKSVKNMVLQMWSTTTTGLTPGGQPGTGYRVVPNWEKEVSPGEIYTWRGTIQGSPARSSRPAGSSRSSIQSPDALRRAGRQAGAAPGTRVCDLAPAAASGGHAALRADLAGCPELGLEAGEELLLVGQALAADLAAGLGALQTGA